jgi:hypothetical protein
MKVTASKLTSANGIRTKINPVLFNPSSKRLSSGAVFVPLTWRGTPGAYTYKVMASFDNVTFSVAETVNDNKPPGSVLSTYIWNSTSTGQNLYIKIMSSNNLTSNAVSLRYQ